MKVYEVWEHDGTAISARAKRVGTFDSRDKAQQCVDDLRNDWNSRSISEIEVS